VRVFIALELPAAFRRDLVAATAAARWKWPQLRWLDAESLHLTLAFLGELDMTGQQAASNAAAAVAGESTPIDITVTGLIGLPPRRPLSVLAARVDSGAAELGALALRLEAALAGAGRDAGYAFRPPEHRPFLPHITLARKGTPTPLRDFRELELTYSVRTTLERIGVFSSEAGRGAQVYTPLSVHPLLSVTQLGEI